MIGWTETDFYIFAAALFACGLSRSLRLYRPLLWGSSVLMLITALFPRPGNPLGQYLFGKVSGTPRLPIELFGVAWWILGAWLVNGVLNLILRRTLFPVDNEPHARRLFADLASVLVYLVALVGIVDTVLKQPISTVLATSGVLAIILGLALQNTLSDVFSGLAINIERPFGAGDWITVSNEVEGQVIEINWRATRIKTVSNELIVIPNSIAAKTTITNHRRLDDAHLSTITIKIDHAVAPTRVIEALQTAAGASAGISPHSVPLAYARRFDDALVEYELTFAIDDFTKTREVRSAVIQRVADSLGKLRIAVGSGSMDVRIIQRQVEGLVSDNSVVRSN